jgi:hypothetical protein
MSRPIAPNARRGGGCALLVSLLVAAAFAGSLVAVAAPGAHAALPRPRVTMITDSVGGVVSWVDQAYAELSAGIELRVEVKACRKLVVEGCYAYGGNPPSALETIRTLGAERDKLGTRLGKLVIVDVGYNDLAETYAAGLDTVMSTLVSLGVQHVIWITLDPREGVWVEINEQIRAAAERWPQLVVADWAPVLAGKPQWIADPVHLNGAGAIAFADFLRPILVATCGAPCQPPPQQPTTTAAARVAPPAALATLLAPRVSGRVATIRWRGNETAVSFDVGVRRTGWRTVARSLHATSLRLRGSPGLRILARVRARNADGAAGPWSAAQAIRFPPA